MKHLIIGYGYCGYYIAQQLINNGQQVITASRSLDESLALDNAQHLIVDVTAEPLSLTMPIDVIHYLIPPQKMGQQDEVMAAWLKQNQVMPRKILYYGSSGVYGNHDGQVVDEDSECLLQSNRQYRRLDAEQQIIQYGLSHKIIVCILRVAAILGPNRIPISKVLAGKSVLKVSEAPWTNSIYVKDLACIAEILSRKLRTAKVFNVSDGIPTPLGSSQRLLSIIMRVHSIYEESFEEVLAAASPMAKEFLLASKKLSNKRLSQYLGGDFCFTDKIEALKASLALSEVPHSLA